MATLLGKYSSVRNRYDNYAKIAFNRSLDYLPDSDFIYEDYNILCDEDRVIFNDSGISGLCVYGSRVKVYSFKMPSVNELFIYHSIYWYITIKCQKTDGEYSYVEFVFDEKPFNRARIGIIHAF